MVAELSPSARAWQAGGRTVSVLGRSVFVRAEGEPVPGRSPLVLIHGFPGSSLDWSLVAPLLPGQVISFDLPGYGFSSKDAAESYSLFTQADVVEALLAKLNLHHAAVIAHDMGDTVAAELAARANEGTLGFALDQIVLTNGSIFIDMAQLTRGQRLTLRMPNRRSLVPMPTWLLRRSLGESFATTAQAPDGVIEELIGMLRLNGGDRLLPILIRYLRERQQHQPRWTSGFVDYEGPLTAIWGTEDPIAVLAMTDRLRELRPDTSVVALDGVGHWPSWEAPERLAGAILTALGS